MSNYQAYRKKSRIPRKILILAVCVIVVLVGATLWVWHSYNKNLKPVGHSHVPQYVTIKPGSSVNQIADQLKSARLIRSASAFEWYVSANNDRSKLQAGTYELTASQSTPQIVGYLINGRISTSMVTIYPGERLDQVKAAFIKKGFKANDVNTALQTKQYRADYPALADNPPSASLEGFLYPDTFEKNSNTKPKQIVEESLTEMDKHLTAKLRAAFVKEGLTTYQGVTLASIVESEVADPADRAQVAQVFLSRLKLGMPLGSDVTAYYGAILAGKQPSVKYNSSYNTLLHKGLPPGPISMISDGSLQAVAHPANTHWLYFVAGDNGKTYFSTTLQQHNTQVQKYCHKKCMH